MFTQPSLWLASIAAAFLAGMIVPAIRETRRPIAATDDAPEQNGYVPASDDQERF